MLHFAFSFYADQSSFFIYAHELCHLVHLHLCRARYLKLQYYIYYFLRIVIQEFANPKNQSGFSFQYDDGDDFTFGLVANGA